MMKKLKALMPQTDLAAAAVIIATAVNIIASLIRYSASPLSIAGLVIVCITLIPMMFVFLLLRLERSSKKNSKADSYANVLADFPADLEDKGRETA